jgi:hypothetical protein
VTGEEEESLEGAGRVIEGVTRGDRSGEEEESLEGAGRVIEGVTRGDR